MPRTLSASIGIAAALLFLARIAPAQDFGQNKVQYEAFDFRVLQTPHFDVHFYPAEQAAATDGARMAERWFARESSLLGEPFSRRPIVFYADHPDFQQTNVIEGMIPQGTGGVTEGARSRVVIPLTGVTAENDHVIGHELVHVFQYAISDSLMGESNADTRGIEDLPLWLVEGMAEYLSLGRADPNTAMWLRDAVLRNDMPSIRQLTTDAKYFPYRYGEALWAYIGGKWGDSTVASLYRASVRQGFEQGIRHTLGMSEDSLSKEWQGAIRDAYTPVLAGLAKPADVGTRLITQDRAGAGQLEVSPALSPDGRWVSFLSGRNLVSIDLVIADAATGHIVKQLTSPNRDEHFSALSFVNAAGSWSPDGHELAYVTVADGDNQLAIFDVDRGRVARQFKLPGVGSIADVAWGPTGQIAVAGTHGGVSDLYLVDPENGHTRQLTDDRFAELHPAWSPDGRTIAFATDGGGSASLDSLLLAPIHLALMDVTSGAVTAIPAFPHAKQINPQFSPDGRSLYFISDRDGISNVYRLSLDDESMTQLTTVATGVSGITDLSPALTVAAKSGRMVVSVFDNAGEVLYRVDSSATHERALAVMDSSGPAPAGMLPPVAAAGSSQVMAYLADATTGLVSAADLSVHKLHTGLSLDYIGLPMVGVTFGGFGTSVSGTAQVGFSDMLNNHIVSTTLYAGGNVRDLGAETFYLNQKRRLNWGVGVAHVPYVLGVGTSIRDTTVQRGGGSTNALVYDQAIARLYLNQAGLIGRYPLSVTRRLEGSVSLVGETFGLQGNRSVVLGNTVIGRGSSNGAVPPGVQYTEGDLAYVGDYSSFGFTSPIAGGRYRLEASPTFGDLSYTTLYADFRRYLFVKPFTFAVRGIHYARYGPDAENGTWVQSVSLGDPSLVRGYEPESFSPAECGPSFNTTGACPVFDQLLGSRVAVANAEVRIPLFGPRELALIPGFLPTELAPFVDAGLAWTKDQHPTFSSDPTNPGRTPIFSAGVSTRVNLFGYLVLEVYYAHAFERGLNPNHIGFQLLPGW